MKQTQLVVSKYDLVIVPDMDAVKRTALVKKELRIGILDPGYQKWNYFIDQDNNPIPGRGRKFIYDVWRPRCYISSNKVRRYFREHGGFYGHVAAFIEWRRTWELEGYHATIPDDDACWHSPDDGLGVPCSYFDDTQRRLDLWWLDHEWADDVFFVAFRELPG